MNRRLQNRLRMLDNTLEHFDQHPALWSDKTKIAEGVDSVRAIVRRMNDAAEDQAGGDTKGLTQEKRRARRTTTDQLVDLGKKASAYAILEKDDDLRQAADLSHSDWGRFTDREFANKARDLLTLVEALPDGALDEYGLAPDETTTIRQSVAAVGRLGAQRDNVGVDRAEATGDLDDLYDETEKPLDVLDRLVPVLIEDEGFVGEYRRVRQIPGR